VALPSREDAFALLCRYTQKPGLLRHAQAVEAAMRAYAPRFAGDPDAWGLAGLLHDLDYERWPEEHPRRGAELLRAAGYPEDIVHAVLAHVTHLGVPRLQPMDRALFAVDELTGLVAATALVQPGRDVRAVTAAAVMRKWRARDFARGCNREEIAAGAAELGVPLDEHVGCVLAAMQGAAAALGLDGGAP
jgi:putative nucleotidyltransferase with HDIG domain